MNKEINLIKGKKKNVLEKEIRIRITRVIAVLSLSAVILAAIGLFLINQFSGIQSSLQKERNATQNIAFFKSKIGTYLLIKSRINDINAVYAQESHIDTAMKSLTDGLPSDVHIDSFSITKQEVSLTVVSSDLASINTFLDFVISKVNNKELIKKLTVTNVIADTALQKYILSIEGQLL